MSMLRLPSKRSRWVGAVATAAALCATLAYLWVSVCQACYERAGGDQFGCVMTLGGPGTPWQRADRTPPDDRYSAIHRRLAWLTFEAPDWMIPGDPGKVRRGAAYALRASATPGDEAALVELARAGNWNLGWCALHLSASWLQRGDGYQERARELLLGPERDQTLALLTLPLVTGRRIEALVRQNHERQGADDGDLEQLFGLSRAELVEEWQEFLSPDRCPSIAECHRELAARYIAPEDEQQRLATGGQDPLLSLSPGYRLVSTSSPERWRKQVGLGMHGNRRVWLDNDALRLRLAGDVLAAPATAFTPEELQSLFGLTRSAKWKP